MLKEAIGAIVQGLQGHPLVEREGNAVHVLDNSRFDKRDGGIIMQTVAQSYAAVGGERGVLASQAYHEYGPLSAPRRREIRIGAGTHPSEGYEYIGITLRSPFDVEVKLEISDKGDISSISTTGPTTLHVGKKRGMSTLEINGLAVGIPKPEEIIRRLSRAELGVDILRG